MLPTASIGSTAPPRARALIDHLARKHGVRTADALGPSQRKEVVAVRREAALVMVNEYGYSMSRVARIFGRHNSTIFNLIGKRSGWVDVVAFNPDVPDLSGEWI